MLLLLRDDSVARLSTSGGEGFLPLPEVEEVEVEVVEVEEVELEVVKVEGSGKSVVETSDALSSESESSATLAVGSSRRRAYYTHFENRR